VKDMDAKSEADVPLPGLVAHLKAALAARAEAAAAAAEAARV